MLHSPAIDSLTMSRGRRRCTSTTTVSMAMSCVSIASRIRISGIAGAAHLAPILGQDVLAAITVVCAKVDTGGIGIEADGATVIIVVVVVTVLGAAGQALLLVGRLAAAAAGIAASILEDALLQLVEYAGTMVTLLDTMLSMMLILVCAGIETDALWYGASGLVGLVVAVAAAAAMVDIVGCC